MKLFECSIGVAASSFFTSAERRAARGKTFPHGIFIKEQHLVKIYSIYWPFCDKW
jgi:hypothetical protein